MFERKTFCVVTGASRGLGRAIAEEIVPKLGAGSVLAVMARTRDELEELKERLEKLYPQIRIHVTVVDLGTDDIQFFETIFQRIIQETGSTVLDFEQAILFNNAGFLGKISQSATDSTLDKNRLCHFISMNLTSMVMLTTHFLKLFTQIYTPHRYLVNVSSVAAVTPFKSLGMYCTCKAARLMYYKVIAAEEPDVKVLTYNPGMVDTRIQLDLRTVSCDPKLMEMAIGWKKNGNLITPSFSAARLLTILEEDNYQRGEQINAEETTYTEDY